LSSIVCSLDNTHTHTLKYGQMEELKLSKADQELAIRNWAKSLGPNEARARLQSLEEAANQVTSKGGVPDDSLAMSVEALRQVVK